MALSIQLGASWNQLCKWKDGRCIFYGEMEVSGSFFSYSIHFSATSYPNSRINVIVSRSWSAHCILTLCLGLCHYWILWSNACTGKQNRNLSFVVLKSTILTTTSSAVKMLELSQTGICIYATAVGILLVLLELSVKNLWHFCRVINHHWWRQW